MLERLLILSWDLMQTLACHQRPDLNTGFALTSKRVSLRVPSLVLADLGDEHLLYMLPPTVSFYRHIAHLVVEKWRRPDHVIFPSNGKLFSPPLKSDWLTPPSRQDIARPANQVNTIIPSSQLKGCTISKISRDSQPIRYLDVRKRSLSSI